MLTSQRLGMRAAARADGVGPAEMLLSASRVVLPPGGDDGGGWLCVVPPTPGEMMEEGWSCVCVHPSCPRGDDGGRVVVCVCPPSRGDDGGGVLDWGCAGGARGPADSLAKRSTRCVIYSAYIVLQRTRLRSNGWWLQPVWGCSGEIQGWFKAVSQPGWIKWKPLLVYYHCINPEQWVFSFSVDLVQFCMYFSQRIHIERSEWTIIRDKAQFNCMNGKMKGLV